MEAPRELAPRRLPVPGGAEEPVKDDEGRADPSKVTMEEAHAVRWKWFR